MSLSPVGHLRQANRKETPVRTERINYHELDVDHLFERRQYDALHLRRWNQRC